MKRQIVAVLALPILAALAQPAVSSAQDSVGVVTKSGKMQCGIQTNDSLNRGNLVVCQGYLPHPPEGNLAVIRADGVFKFSNGDLGSRQYSTVLEYGEVYHFLGWTVEPDESGTRFTNDTTGHGMRISTDFIQTF
ncbi:MULTISPECIES: hypothetical protein [unclassified Mycobacterium]|uniref:hypothetical protein n=1 Tax=unclassified Mycobacterium TaxID=2642494 RepID=UPI00074009DF|nr:MULTISPECIES: hypothetical protein [unclassified Mycobacterium]KUH86480.1 hypothetical protein AU187_06935 [Mycobacterium sp. IS-1556]KUH86595.1 hypothetical protein AU185_18420 [Mycobacterium sp. GA-0227b]KUH91872.1 hypothetical protein AU186_05135 [Mycobacterium sp. GA-1999]